MNHFAHPNCTHLLQPPKQWNEPTACDPLAVCITTDANNVPLIASYWKPDEAELKRLNEGGCVQLSIYGTSMPPVWVGTL